MLDVTFCIYIHLCMLYLTFYGMATFCREEYIIDVVQRPASIIMVTNSIVCHIPQSAL